MLQGGQRMLTSGAPPQPMGPPGPQYPGQAEGQPGPQQAMFGEHNIAGLMSSSMKRISVFIYLNSTNQEFQFVPSS